MGPSVSRMPRSFTSSPVLKTSRATTCRASGTESEGGQMARTYAELGTDIIAGEVYPGLERLQYRLRQLAATRGGDQAYTLAREVEGRRDRLRQAWGLLKTQDAQSGVRVAAPAQR